MLDKLEPLIPFKEQYVIQSEGSKYGLIDLMKLGIPLETKITPISEDSHHYQFKDITKTIYRAIDEEGGDSSALSRFIDGHIINDPRLVTKQSNLRVPWESIRSSSGSMAMKVVNDNANFPAIRLKCSPAKLMQGHNVFGSNNIRLGVSVMLTLFCKEFPQIADMLDFKKATIQAFDSTFHVKLDSDIIALQVLRFLANIAVGQMKPKFVGTTTIYYDAAKDDDAVARHCKRMVYMKHPELLKYIKTLAKKSKQNNGAFDAQLLINENPQLIEYTKGILRFEMGMRPRMMKRLEIPNNLFEFIDYAEKYEKEHNEHFTQYAFRQGFKDIFKALAGHKMMKIDDTSIKNKLYLEFGTVSTKTGKTSYRKANSIYKFYCDLRRSGHAHVKKELNRQTLWRYETALEAIGLSRGYIHNLQSEYTKDNVLPIVRFTDIDFSNQAPDWYEEPTLETVEPKLRLVS